MLRISKLADYAIVVMNELASTDDDLLSAADISTNTKIPEPTVGKILKALARDELLTSTRGAKGGYQLAMDTTAINLVQIISAIDGEIALTECDKETSACSVQASCTVSHNWQRISHAIREALAGISLADMKQPIPESVIQFKIKDKLVKAS
tara:strand:+ start:116437 stop:116892 length:456 start_codon:yes stop_codon:yes gene_type:complete